MCLLIAKSSKLAEQKVLLLDGAPSFKGYSMDSFSNRVYALNQNTVDLLTSIDAWSTITKIRYQAVKRMQVDYSIKYISISIPYFNTLFMFRSGIPLQMLLSPFKVIP